MLDGELRDLAIPLPKLNVMTVDELLGGFDRRLIIGAIEQNGPHEMAVAANDVNPIIGHLRQPCRRKSHPLLAHKNPEMSVRFRTRSPLTKRNISG